MSDKFKMSLSLNVLNHLGINLYSNIPAVLSEIVANAWDADAQRVDITISDDQIIIKDDGCGMNADDINNKFLYVGYQKREQSAESPIYHRKYMGRKGIGKLSMFSIAKEVDVISKKKNYSRNIQRILSHIGSHAIVNSDRVSILVYVWCKIFAGCWTHILK